MSTDNPFASILTPSAAADQLSLNSGGNAASPFSNLAGGTPNGANPFAQFADPTPDGLKLNLPSSDNSVFTPPPTPFDTSSSANNVVTDTSGIHAKVAGLSKALASLSSTGIGQAGAPASSLTLEQFAARAGVPTSQVTGTPGNYMVGPATTGNNEGTGNGGNTGGADNTPKAGTVLPPGYTTGANGLILDASGKVAGYTQNGTFYDTNGQPMTAPAAPTTDPTAPAIPTAPTYGQFTPEQQARIDAAGKNAGGTYDTLIASAMEAKNQGLAKSEVAAGEKGGFMNTQFAGLSAVLPTQGNSWEGQGGELQNIKSGYDRTITQLQVQKQQAIEAAKSAMQDYINTGNQKSFENAMTSYNAAVKANQDAIAASNNKVDQLQKWANLQETLNKPLTAQTKQMQDYAYEQMAKYPSAFQNITADQLKNLTPDQINKAIVASPEYKDELLKAHNEALKAGFVAGTNVSIGGTTYNSKGQAIGSGGQPISGSALSGDSVNFWAQAAASGVNTNNLLPSLGVGAAAVATKTKLLNQMASNAKTLGIDGATFAAMVADSKAKQATYTQLQKVGSQTQVNEQNANKNFQQLIGLSEKLDKSKLNTAVPALNEWIRSGQLKLTGDPDVNNFMALLSTSLTEYAKVVSGQTGGAAVTDSANRQMEKLLSSGMNTDTIKSFASTAQQEMSNRTSSYDDALKGLFGNIQTLNDTSGGLGGIGTEKAIGTIPAEDIGGAKQYIQAAIADKNTYPNREALEQDILKHNPGYKLDDIANLVQSIWTDNLPR